MKNSICYDFSLLVLICTAGCGGSYQTLSPLTITPASLPNGTLGSPYSQNIQVSGGAAPFTWTVVGMLPHNLQLASNASNAATIWVCRQRPWSCQALAKWFRD
jgi:hypothetical protein